MIYRWIHLLKGNDEIFLRPDASSLPSAWRGEGGGGREEMSCSLSGFIIAFLHRNMMKRYADIDYQQTETELACFCVASFVVLHHASGPPTNIKQCRKASLSRD